MKHVILVMLVIIPIINIAQTKTAHKIIVFKCNSSIVLDGKLTEPCWHEAVEVSGFYRNYPDDTGYANSDTKVRMLFDDDYLYIGAKMENSKDFKAYTLSTLKRDQFNLLDDCFTVQFDTYHDQTNCIAFKVTPHGTQSEFLGSDGGKEWDVSWDYNWQCGTTKTDSFWIAEIKIPFSGLRFNTNAKNWRVGFWRNNVSENEVSSWVPIPRNFQVYEDFTRFGLLEFQDTINPKLRRYNILPSIVAGISRDFKAKENTTDYTISAGIDAKIVVTSAMSLDLTLNPDFSQTEVDQQQANISQFELSYPEKRQFFTENSDLFAGFGISTNLFGETRPFFSRRIGIAYNPNTGFYENIPIFGGARLSGKLNNQFRVGLMSLQTGSKKDFYVNETTEETENLYSYNYSVAALQYKLFTNSNIGAMFINKENFEKGYDFNRTATIQYNWSSKNNSWNSKWIASQTYQDTVNKKNGFYGTQYTWNNKKLLIRGSSFYVGNNYNPAVGFVTRKGVFFNFRPDYLIYPKKDNSIIKTYIVSTGVFSNYNIHLNPYDFLIWSGGAFIFKSTAEVWLGFRFDYRKLRFDFDPSFKNNRFLAQNTEYQYRWFYLYWNTDLRKKFSIRNEFDYGGHYNGQKLSLIGNFKYRIQPKGSINFNYSYHKIELPAPFEDNDIIAAGPAMDWAFSKNIFFSLYTQYNSLIENVNFNARIQWRFAPISDIYLIYTDNYTRELFHEKSRAIMVKISYWI